jgi:hypothetical protein
VQGVRRTERKPIQELGKTGVVLEVDKLFELRRERFAR